MDKSPLFDCVGFFPVSLGAQRGVYPRPETVVEKTLYSFASAFTIWSASAFVSYFCDFAGVALLLGS